MKWMRYVREEVDERGRRLGVEGKWIVMMEKKYRIDR